MNNRIRSAPVVMINKMNDLTEIGKMVTDLEIVSDCCNESSLTQLNLSGYQLLKRLLIGNQSFKFVKRVLIDQLNRLETIIIGSCSFTLSLKETPQERTKRIFSLRNCPRLVSLEIGRYSFSDYHAMELKKLPALKHLMIGHKAFHSVSGMLILN